MKQCKELVINAEKCRIFKMREVIITVLKKIKKSQANYTNPPIPDGYKYVEGEWHNGFVIEKISDGSQFVWIPVGSIDSTKLGALKIWFITICGEKYGATVKAYCCNVADFENTKETVARIKADFGNVHIGWRYCGKEKSYQTMFYRRGYWEK